MNTLKSLVISGGQTIKVGIMLTSKGANKSNIKYHIPQRLLSSSEIGSKSYFDDIVSKNKVVVFMKGTPDAPKCGFSNAISQILRMHGVDAYDAYNVLDDEKIRQGIKEYSDWPTIPQVYFNGEFVGGCDILIQMHQSGELIDELQKLGITSALLKEDLKKDEDQKT